MPSGRLGLPGSSPHTRGALSDAVWQARRAGIIPAYAGSTSSASMMSYLRRDHPRIRGEHKAWTCDDVDKPGSSPHTRGAPLLENAPQTHSGIIPAYAGSTRGWSSSPSVLRDHPRIRGEHTQYVGARYVPLGSSPHTRGARPARQRRRSHGGIIPAYAGSTAWRTSKPAR